MTGARGQEGGEEFSGVWAHLQRRADWKRFLMTPSLRLSGPLKRFLHGFSWIAFRMEDVWRCWKVNCLFFFFFFLLLPAGTSLPFSARYHQQLSIGAVSVTLPSHQLCKVWLWAEPGPFYLSIFCNWAACSSTGCANFVSHVDEMSLKSGVPTTFHNIMTRRHK